MEGMEGKGASELLKEIEKLRIEKGELASQLEKI